MSICNYTQLVSPNVCLGDSLATFNANFSALDEGLCRVQDIEQGVGVEAVSQITEQDYNVVVISNKNSFAFGKDFDFCSTNTETAKILLKDGTTVSVTTFPYVSALTALNVQEDPYATFSTISLTNNIPKVSLFWTASGSVDTTLYATNSSSPFSPSTIEFNGPVVSLLSSENILYVGGEFTSVGGVECKKICAINLYGGNDMGATGVTGSLLPNPLSNKGAGDLESYGSVNVIKEYKTETEHYIIVGGSFQSLGRGRGLSIYNNITKDVYPFYVNGIVHDLEIIGSELYVSGKFDYINYAAQSVSVVSGLRVYCNGLAKISLSKMERFPNSSIDRTFANNVVALFATKSAAVNCLATKGGVLYAGGSFEVKYGNSLNAKNLVSVNSDGTQNINWKPVLIGEAYAMEVDGDYLYVGGNIKHCYTVAQYYDRPRPTSGRYEAYNAICFKASSALTPVLEFNWKPRFNGTVTSMAFHDDDYGSYVYCVGSFTQVNEQAANHIAAIEKSYENNSKGEYIVWRNHLEKAPPLVNHGIVRFEDSIVVGGNFTNVNNEKRSYLARLTQVDKSLSAVPLSAVKWEIGTQLCSQGAPFSKSFTNYITTSAYFADFGYINETVLKIDSDALKGYSAGELLRFFVKRPVASDNSCIPAYVLGWKVDFN